jgi:putative spermidine/putrescine transport system permease protein
MAELGQMTPPKTGNEDGRFALKFCWPCFSLPGLLVMGVTFVFPLCILAVFSVMRDGRNGRLIYEATIQNYVVALSDPFYLSVLGDTILLGVMVAVICLALSFPVAYFLARTSSRWRGLLIFLALAPLTISAVIRNIGWIPVLGETGAINQLLMGLGLIDTPLRMINNFTGVVIGLVNALLPYSILLLMIVIQRVGREIEEAAINLGASRWQLVWWVLVPLTRRGTTAAGLLVFTLAIASYTTPAIMGGRRVLVMSTFIEQQIGVVLKNAFGSALTIILLLVAVGFIILSSRTFDRKEA